MFEKILVPLDGSELSERILVQVARLIEQPGAEVRSIRVLDGFAVDQALLHGEDPYGIAGAQLAKALLPFGQVGVQTGWDTYVGDPATKILVDAEQFGPSLIAMASHGRSGADRWIRGSTAERVLRRSRHPVLLANPRAPADKLPFEKILVPIDGSGASALILPLAREVARLYDSELVLLHVIDGGSGRLVIPGAGAPHSSNEAEAILESHRADLGNTKVSFLTARGSPAYAILHAAKESKADLIAMTTHGRSGPSRWAFGSTAEHVLHQSPTPLLVLRTAGPMGPIASETEPAAAAAR